MGLFSSRRQPVAQESWHPDGSGVTVRRTYAEDGPSCVAGTEAFGARFTLASAPRSAITVWAYPVEDAEDYPGSFLVGYRIVCSELWPGHVDPYEESFLIPDEEAEFWTDLAACSAACRTVAENMARCRGASDLPDEVAVYFDWDGDILSLGGE